MLCGVSGDGSSNVTRGLSSPPREAANGVAWRAESALPVLGGVSGGSGVPSETRDPVTLAGGSGVSNATRRTADGAPLSLATTLVVERDVGGAGCARVFTHDVRSGDASSGVRDDDEQSESKPAAAAGVRRRLLDLRAPGVAVASKRLRAVVASADLVVSVTASGDRSGEGVDGDGSAFSLSVIFWRGLNGW